MNTGTTDYARAKRWAQANANQSGRAWRLFLAHADSVWWIEATDRIPDRDEVVYPEHWNVANTETSVNGIPGPWGPMHRALWAIANEGSQNLRVVAANFFSSRPYQDEYDRGSNRIGFTYTAQKPDSERGLGVYQVSWPIASAPEVVK